MATRGTVLFVEDDPIVAGLVREVLDGAGYRTLTARTIADGCEFLAAFRIGLVLTAAFHPGPAADRWAALEPLARAARTIPLVLCSARHPDEYPDLAAHGFAAFLPMPFDRDELLASVASLLPADVAPPPVGGPGPQRPVAPGEGRGHAR